LQAQAALASLGEMVASIAHEVRSPLAGILAAVDVLADRSASDSVEQPVLQQIRQRIASLDSLVHELLLFARPKDLRFVSLPLLVLLEDTAVRLRASASAGEIEFLIEGEDVSVRGDTELLKSVFLNLSENAAQAMSGKGSIRVVVTREADRCRVVFHDSGPGIPPELADRVFEPFFTTKHHGIGLGLAIARRIIEAHGGEVAVLRTSERGGSIVVTLPIAVHGDEPRAGNASSS